ncbi:MAG: hypothetical protein ACI87F_001343, partial [Candidatus Azotimanducaceae bacterium]
MKKHLLYLFLLLTLTSFSQPNKEAYKSGEWLKYRMHYGFINAGYATIKIDSTSNQNQEAYHVVGKG